MSDPQNRPDDEEGDAGKEEDRRRLVVIRRHLVNAHEEEIKNQTGAAGIGEEPPIGTEVLTEESQSQIENEVNEGANPSVSHPIAAQGMGVGIVDAFADDDKNRHHEPNQTLDPLTRILGIESFKTL